MRLRPLVQRRNGAALIVAAVALAVVGVYAGSVTWNLLAGRRVVNHRERQLQADALARSGVERAAARLLADPAAANDETVELIPDSQLRVAVRPEPGKPNVFRVTSEARFPRQGPEFVSRSLTRSLRRTTHDKEVRIEIVPEAAVQP
jgi:hypothetical protein